MKESFLKIILYLFSHYQTQAAILGQDPVLLSDELQKKGFKKQAIQEVLGWLEACANISRSAHDIKFRRDTSFRSYNTAEMKKLSKEARGFIVSSEKMGFLDPKTREVLIDRAMALDTHEVSIDDLRCVMNVLFLRTQEDINFENLQRVQMLAPKRVTLH
jgi:Smg protein